MRCGYFDCFGGAAGDMILGALIDAGLPVEQLEEVAARLGLPGVAVQAHKVQRAGLAATQVRVASTADAQPHRHLPDILEIIRRAGLSPAVTERACRVFTRLGEAEAAAHGIPIEQVHFHEVGAVDALVDIVGASAGIEALGLERILCSAIPTGSGTVTCAHGVLPVPAPATADLLRGVPLAPCDVEGELTTPTGAALLTTCAAAFGPLPPMKIDSIGYGAGTREFRARPNVLRLFVGEALAPNAPADDSPEEWDSAVLLETQLDDVDGQTLAHACQRLLEAGALDAFMTPILMKKGRPGQLLTAVCRPEDVATLEAIVFSETTTLGIRRQTCLRHKLSRVHETVNTRFGPIQIKLGRRGEAVLRAWPEYADCAAAARDRGVTLRQVQDAALQAWMERDRPDG